jgi:hypothetical protein
VPRMANPDLIVFSPLMAATGRQLANALTVKQLL